MASRQHAPLVLIAPGEATRSLQPMRLHPGRGTGGYDEAWVRDITTTQQIFAFRPETTRYDSPKFAVKTSGFRVDAG